MDTPGAPSLLLALLDTTPEAFAAVDGEAQELLLALLYDLWSRDEEVEALWLDVLQSTQPHDALQQIWTRLQQHLRAAAVRVDGTRP